MLAQRGQGAFRLRRLQRIDLDRRHFPLGRLGGDRVG
jgi:hypothetical protein